MVNSRPSRIIFHLCAGAPKALKGADSILQFLNLFLPRKTDPATYGHLWNPMPTLVSSVDS